MNPIAGLSLGIFAFGLSLGANYVFALLGEPRALWLMRDIFGWL